MNKGHSPQPGHDERVADAKLIPAGRRLAFEQSVQILSVLVSILDRIILAGLFFRFWGPQSFETWSVVVSVAGLIGMAEFGFNMYFKNAISNAITQDEYDKAKQLFKQGFTLLLSSTIVGLIILTGYTLLSFDTGFASTKSDPNVLIAAILLLATAAGLRIPFSVIAALYRANLIYARYSLMWLFGDLLRIFTVSLVVIFFDEALVFAAMATFFAMTTVHIGYILHDYSKRFPEFVFGLMMPSWREFSEIFLVSSGFFANTLATVCLTSLPVLFLNGLVEEAGVISAFVVARILFGLPRLISQATSVVIGFESSRFIAKGDIENAWKPIRDSSRLVSVISGTVVAGLFCFGEFAVTLWMGNPTPFQYNFAILAAVPVLLVPTASVINNVLITANHAYQAASVRICQLIVFLGVYFVMQNDNPGINILFALATAEVFGLGLVGMYFQGKILKSFKLYFYLSMSFAALASTAILMGINWLIAQTDVGSADYGLVVRLGSFILAAAALFWFAAIDHKQRTSILRRFS